MRHIAVDEETYATVKAVAEREGRLLKGVVKLAVQGYAQPEEASSDSK